MRKTDIGAALDDLTSDVIRLTLDLVRQYRISGNAGVLKQAVDTPHRARAQIAAWISSYNAANGANSAQTFLASCLAAVGSASTLSQIDSALSALESQALALVNHVKSDGWTWNQVASAIESAISAPSAVQFTYASLPIPAGYTTVWSEPW